MKMNRQTTHATLIALISIFLFFGCNQSETSKNINSEGKDDLKTSLIDRLLQAEIENHMFMGTITIHLNGKTVYSKATGYDHIESQKKSTGESRYRIGSVSKNFTAVLVLKAAEEGKIRLDETIERFVPALKNAGDISIRNLLNHSSGIHSFTNDKMFGEYHTRGKTSKEMLQIICGYECDFSPGSKSKYSNSNYFILSLILEDLYGMDYAEILRSKICLPLSLESTYYGGKIRLDNNETCSYTYAGNWKVLPETDLSVTKGAGGIVSTSSDLNHYFECLFNGAILSKKSLEKMLMFKNGFGLGFERFSYNDRIGYGHGGKIDGFSSFAIHFPNEKMTISILTNSDYANFTDLVSGIVGVFFRTNAVKVSEAELINYTGKYQSEQEKGFIAEFGKNGNTLVHIINGEFKAPLIYKGNRKFVLEQNSLEPMIFIFTQDGTELQIQQGAFNDHCIKLVDSKKKP